MTSTNLDQNPSVTSSSDFHSSTANPLDKPESPESSFSDAYIEEVGLAEVKNGESTQVDDDDYAMTFDSDGDESTDRHDIQGIDPNVDTDNQSMPPNVLATDSSIVSKMPHNGTENYTPHLNHAFLDQNSNSMGTNLDNANTSKTIIDPPSVKPQIFDDFTAGGIDIQQLLDNITANAEKPDSPHLKNHNLPIHASLPPRPNISQNRVYADEGPKYYAGTSGLPPASTSYRPPGIVSSLIAAGAPGTSTDPRSGLPPPPTASFRGQISANNPPNHPSYPAVNRLPAQELANNLDSDEGDDLETRWSPEVQKMYDEFLEDERRYVTEGLWDRFPMGSRLFIGNLPSEKVTKRDLFHVFYHYGKIAQISIKQAYGFVQFLRSEHCHKALDCEQGAEVRGRKMHLEISKPQKNTRNAQHSTSTGQRVKSPDRTVGNRNCRNNDRYDRQAQITRNDEYGRSIRSRDDYRPIRSVTPPRGMPRLRDSYTSNPRDPYETRDRRRSRSPYGHRDTGRYRERSPSPRVRELADDVDLSISHRDHRDVPDVQIILMEQLDRQFISWVESEMRSRGIKTNVMILSPRVPMETVIRRQILEGVLAVTRLDVISQNTSKIPLQVFDRQGGANNVRFDEYQNLEPKIAGELVLRAKQNQVPPQPSAYPQASFTIPTYSTPSVTTTPNLASLVGSLDNASLQKLLGTLNIPSQQQSLPVAENVASSPAIDLAGFFGGLKQNSISQGFVSPTQADHYNNNIHAIQTSFRETNPQSVISQSQSQPAQQVQNIMAQLARFRR